MKSIVLGNAFDEETRMGPLISNQHLEKVEAFVEAAKSSGAKLLCGGKRPEDHNLRNGFFYLPTLFSDCDESMEIVKKEVFGPVISIERFSSEADAIEKANNTSYGLSAGFWTSDRSRIERVSKALRFGTVLANDFNVYFVQAPWGGYKTSGLGRELGSIGLEEYQEVKHVFENLKPKALAWF